ncbi:MAG: hypothetical protein EPO61_09115 [Nitrospirae bacterium]|nr:MAG: hypothetical protein EPO61_09115 [Nitrospirota bacterium]
MGEFTDKSGRSFSRTDADLNRFPRRERGAALIGAVLGVLILSMVGTVSVNLAVQEIESVQGMRDAAIARHLAEAGADLVTTWFHNSAAEPAGAGELFKKRYDRPDSGPSFFDAQGRSQFTGTADRPDLVFDAARAADHRLLNDPASGWFRGLRGLGEVRKLKVYGPSRPGLLCTVAVTASVGKLTKTLAFQLAANDMPSLRSAVEVGVNGEPQAADGPLPLWVHWGEVQVKGDVHLPNRKQIPAKTSLASLSGWSYADMLRREDRWLEIKVGGDAYFPPAAPGVVTQPDPDPTNVLPRQDPYPGLRLDRWDYDRMKKQARRYGTYYAMDRQGLLYRNGTVTPGTGLRPEELFSSESGGDHPGFVFIDTLDGRQPEPTNLGTLSLETEYLDGVFFINAHLQLKPKGSGRPVSAFTPPSGSPADPDWSHTRVPVQLTGIHLNGVVYAAGDVVVEGYPRIYGALVAGGKLMAASASSGPVELWYNHELAEGLVKGMPLVSLVPGSFQELF